jgi:chromatin remodeling complex protein RSC6
MMRPLSTGERMAKKTAAKSSRTANAAFMRPVTPSSELAEVVGSKPLPRTEVTKKLWAYIKKNGLQDKKNKRMINADATLKPIFGGKSSVNMFDMTKLVGKHLK